MMSMLRTGEMWRADTPRLPALPLLCLKVLHHHHCHDHHHYFYKLKASSSTSQSEDSLYRDTCCILMVWKWTGTSLRYACNLSEITQGPGEENTERVICVTYNQVFFLLYVGLQGDSKQRQTSHDVISKERIHHIQMNRNPGFSCKCEKTTNQSFQLWISH